MSTVGREWTGVTQVDGDSRVPSHVREETSESARVVRVPQAGSAVTWWVVARYLDSGLSWH